MNYAALASGSKGNCHAFSDGRRTLLVDAGISLKQIRLRLRRRLGSGHGAGRWPSPTSTPTISRRAGPAPADRLGLPGHPETLAAVSAIHGHRDPAGPG